MILASVSKFMLIQTPGGSGVVQVIEFLPPTRETRTEYAMPASGPALTVSGNLSASMKMGAVSVCLFLKFLKNDKK